MIPRYLVLPFLLFCLVSKAQLIRISDAKSGVGLPYAVVYLKSGSQGFTANEEGLADCKFQAIKNSKIDTLCCNYIGYLPFRKAVDGSKPINVSEIKLQPSNELKEVVIRYEERPEPVALLKNVIKKIPQNYSTDPTRLRSFIRETVMDSGVYVQLAEAQLTFYNSPYPQKNDNDAWKRWYYDDDYFMDSHGYSFMEADGFTTNFNSENDQVRIDAVRSSNGFNMFSPGGGPLSMTASDKVKYLRDFLDEDLFDHYNYKLLEDVEVGGRNCYTISFYPKPDDRRMVTDMSRKTIRAIYLGRIYIDREDLAVLRYDYQLSTDINFGFHQGRVPLDNRLQFEYAKQDGKYYLSHVSSTLQLADYLLGRELWVDEVQTQNALPFNPEEIYKHTRWSALYNYYQVYNADRWKYYLLHPREQKIENDLAKYGKLEDQFSARFLKNEDLKPSIPEKRKDWLVFKNDSIQDDYRWMENIADTGFVRWLDAENKYYRNELIPYRNQQARIFRIASGMYKKSSGEGSMLPGEFFIDVAENRRSLFYQMDSLDRREVMDADQLFSRYPDHMVMNVQHSKLSGHYTLELNKGGGLRNVYFIIPDGKKTITDSLKNVYSLEWIDSAHLLYSKMNASMRGDKLYLHDVATGNDKLISEEADPKYDIEVKRSGNRLMVIYQSKNGNEVVFPEMISDRLTLTPTFGRKEGISYDFKVFGDQTYALYKDRGKNAALYTYDKGERHLVVKARRNVVLDDVLQSKNFLAVIYYKKAYPHLKYRSLTGKKWHEQKLPYNIGDVTFSETQKGLDHDQIRLNISTLKNEEEKWEFGPQAKEMTRISLDSNFVGGMVDNIVTVRKMVRSGWRKVPVTLSYAPSRMSENALVIHTYGAYGGLLPDDFNYMDVLLMRSGYAVANVHVRGGGELGERWYQKGKLLHKKNSVKDLIRCTEALQKSRGFKPEKTAVYGNSAGGLVVATAINERPDLYKAVVLDHPYVDVCGTMIKDSLPLTTDEYLEWGTPEDKGVYGYMKSYSPYQNIHPANYPNVLCIAGYNDQQTPVWMVGKYVAALRDNNLSHSEILFHTNLNGGHLVPAGDKGLKQLVETIAFINAALFPRN